MIEMIGQHNGIMPFQGAKRTTSFPQRDALGWDMLGFQPVMKSSDHDWATPYENAHRVFALKGQHIPTQRIALGNDDERYCVP
ncbi:hypothetical protein AGMMS49982_05380 [Bacteroidia bacterium]|nr:hypothetical protein AGMMS49982_05380 [Bacteroidia bacterium]